MEQPQAATIIYVRSVQGEPEITIPDWLTVDEAAEIVERRFGKQPNGQPHEWEFEAVTA